MKPPSHPTLRFSDVFPPTAQSLSGLHGSHRLHLTYNARGAFYQLLRSLPARCGRTVLLPAFHCTALVEAVAKAGYQSAFYRVAPDLTVDLEDVSRKMSHAVAAVVIIHYFGFPTDVKPFLRLAKPYRAYVIEDCAHSFLSRHRGEYVGHRGDFALFSYYKFAPSLAGGGLGINRGDFCGDAVLAAPLRERLVIAKRLLEQAIENSPSHPLRAAILHWEQKRAARRLTVKSNPPISQFIDDPYMFRCDLADARIPWLCRQVIESCNWKQIAGARQRNYRLVSRLIRDTTAIRRVLPELPDEVCPWAFPILMKNRLSHETRLQALGVPLFTFGEVLHPLLQSADERTRSDAEYLSSHLLLLPVHAQLNEQELRACADIFNRFVGDLDGSEHQAFPERDSIPMCEGWAR